MKEALIIFAKNPVKGKVKTRLAATTGDAQALLIYHQLLSKTYSVTKDLFPHKFVFYSDFIDENGIWISNQYQKKLQEGNNLGDKMKNAFNCLFTEGYNKIVIIGTDCFELKPGDIDNAFSLLNNAEIVIGPAFDGGYYLLGMNKFLPDIFQNIEWSTDKVFDQTLSVCKKWNIKVLFLRQLNDIDTIEDLQKEPTLFNTIKNQS